MMHGQKNIKRDLQFFRLHLLRCHAMPFQPQQAITSIFFCPCTYI